MPSSHDLPRWRRNLRGLERALAPAAARLGLDAPAPFEPWPEHEPGPDHSVAARVPGAHEHRAHEARGAERAPLRPAGRRHDVQPGQWSVGPARLDDADLAADRWADDLVAQRLPGVRRYCERWATTLSALFALLGAATLVSSDAAVRALDTPWAQLYGVCWYAPTG